MLYEIELSIIKQVGSDCQSVKHMSSNDEFIILRNENNETLLAILICYYSPLGIYTPCGHPQMTNLILTDVPHCYNEIDKGFYYRGNVNVTKRGPCEPWSLVHRIDALDENYDHVGLEENDCRSTVPMVEQPSPWCYVKGQQEICGIESCPGISFTFISNYNDIIT